MRIAAGVEYDGTRFSGWQHQANGRSVQDCVEAALSKVADRPVQVVCAGRTDAGVHAVGQVIHFDTGAERTERSWVLGANVNLPEDVSLLWARYVDEDFHARFGARARSYRYLILNRWVRPAAFRHGVTWERRPLDAERMHAAAQTLLGEHDFSTFRALACQAKSPVRCVHEISVRRRGDTVAIDVTANAFLHHMVRNIAGVLSTIGAGERAPEWVEELLSARDRRVGGVTAPPGGLYLVHVAYEARYDLPNAAHWPELRADG
jgi:tRNA pseudouridine38-40 synthase